MYGTSAYEQHTFDLKGTDMKKLLPMIIAMLLLSTVCTAEGLNVDLPDSAAQYIDDDWTADSDADSVLEKLKDDLLEKLSELISPCIKKAVSLALTCALCSLVSVFAERELEGVICLCGCAAVVSICVSDMDSYIRMGEEAINDISVFSKAILPTLCTAGVTAGTAGASAAKYAASALFIDIFVTLAQNVIMPLILLFLASSIAAAAFKNKSLASMSRLLKWVCTSLMTILTLAFTVYISVSSAVSSSGDALASKVAKTAISTALPVVGGIISDAAASVVAGAAILKNSVGVLGMLAVLGICLVPFATLGLNYLLLKAASAVGSALEGCAGPASAASGCASAVGMILGLVGSGGIMMFISILSFVKAVSEI